MSPNEINFLLHCYHSPTPHSNVTAPVIVKTINMFLEEGIIKHAEGDNYRTTRRGEALVKLLCNVSFPVAAWVDINGKLIDL